jgi:hypothetical protein
MVYEKHGYYLNRNRPVGKPKQDGRLCTSPKCNNFFVAKLYKMNFRGVFLCAFTYEKAGL